MGKRPFSTSMIFHSRGGISFEVFMQYVINAFGQYDTSMDIIILFFGISVWLECNVFYYIYIISSTGVQGIWLNGILYYLFCEAAINETWYHHIFKHVQLPQLVAAFLSLFDNIYSDI